MRTKIKIIDWITKPLPTFRFWHCLRKNQEHRANVARRFIGDREDLLAYRAAHTIEERREHTRIRLLREFRSASTEQFVFKQLEESNRQLERLTWEIRSHTIQCKKAIDANATAPIDSREWDMRNPYWRA